MDNDRELSGGLLEQEGLSTAEYVNREWREIERVLRRDRRRAAALMWLAVGLVATALICFLAFATYAFAFDRGAYRASLREHRALVGGGAPFDSPEAQEAYAPSPVSFWKELALEGLPIIAAWSFGLAILLAVVWFFFARVVDAKALSVRLANIELRLRE